MPLTDAHEMYNQSYVDTYDPTVGPYGGENVGPAPTFNLGWVAPVPGVPSGLPTATERLYGGHGSSTLTGDLDTQVFEVHTHHVLTIEGDVRLIVREKFVVQNCSRIELAPDATLTIFFYKDATIQDHAVVNPDTTRPGDVRIYQMSGLPVILQNHSALSGVVWSNDGYLHVQDGSDFYGALSARTLYMQNQGGGHFCGINPILSTTVSPLYD